MTRCRNQIPYPVYTTVLTGKNLPAHLAYRSRIPEQVFDLLEHPPRPETPPGTMKQKLIQTMYRDSEAQTEPYTPEMDPNTPKTLEILTLGWLAWTDGLPAGINEVTAIERNRQKRAWLDALPIPFDQTTRYIRTMIIEAIEINEWHYREEMIQAVNSLRLQLSEKLAKEKCRELKNKSDLRLQQYIQMKKDEKKKKLIEIKSGFNRKLRKLTFKQQKVNPKYHRWNIIKQFADKTSELYAPQLRFGEDPRHWHEKIKKSHGYWRVFKKLEIMHQTVADIPELLVPAFDFKKKSKPKIYNKDLCIRATKWTEQNLERLHEELRHIRRRRYSSPRPCALKKKVEPQVSEAETPYVTGPSDDEEDLFQAILFLQKTIKGRAIQAVMFEGRVKCQELLEELKSTHALQNSVEDERAQMRLKIYGLQREADIEQLQERKKREILANLEGKTTGDTLDFLSKELLRLQDERRTHAQALVADRERHRREAVEAGRRQVEEQRRREHDEMFKQIVKVHQNAAHDFLNEATTDNRHWLANREAREYITEVAKKIDQEAKETTVVPMFTRPEDLRHKEIVADLIHNFALPEAEKQLVRQRLRERQRNYLKICHDEVYSNIEKIAEAKRTVSGHLLPLPMIGKHKIPPIVRVKYQRLKRMHESSSSSKDSQASEGSILNEAFVIQQMTQKSDNESSQHDAITQDFSVQGSSKNTKTQETSDWSTGFSIQAVVLKATDESDKDKSKSKINIRR